MADTDYLLFSDGNTVYHSPLHDVGGGLYSEVPLNPQSWAMRTITHDEAEINLGDHYFVANYTTLASDGVFALGLVTPNTTEWAHLQWTFMTIGQMTAQIFESASFASSDWTPVTAQNNNRNSASATSLTVVSNTSFTDSDGTQIAAFSLGDAANPANTSGGQVRLQDKLILKQNTQYVFKLVSQTAGNIITYAINWFEHIDKT